MIVSGSPEYHVQKKQNEEIREMFKNAPVSAHIVYEGTPNAAEDFEPDEFGSSISRCFSKMGIAIEAMSKGDQFQRNTSNDVTFNFYSRDEDDEDYYDDEDDELQDELIRSEIELNKAKTDYYKALTERLRNTQ